MDHQNSEYEEFARTVSVVPGEENEFGSLESMPETPELASINSVSLTDFDENDTTVMIITNNYLTSGVWSPCLLYNSFELEHACSIRILTSRGAVMAVRNLKPGVGDYEFSIKPTEVTNITRFGTIYEDVDERYPLYPQTKTGPFYFFKSHSIGEVIVCKMYHYKA